MGFWYVIAGILGLGLLMVVHEAGHHFVARAFGMRVVRFSIGFGPALLSHRPKDSPTTYQVALIPFLAYVQIAGMNPFEEVDPEDRGSYANASLFARMATIFAGPLANYLFASVLFFGAFAIGGDQVPTTRVDVMPDGPAAQAQLRNGDKVVAIDGRAIPTFEAMRLAILASPEKPLRFTVERGGERLEVPVTPRRKASGEGGEILVSPQLDQIPLPLGEVTKRALVAPAQVVRALAVFFGRLVTGKERPDIRGPIGIVEETSKAARMGIDSYLAFLGLLSAYLGGFNLIPFPALDGGRLLFLGYEAVTRRRPNPSFEVISTVAGLVALFAVLIVASWFDAVRPR